MKILRFDYEEYPDSDRCWSVTGLELGAINLLVGRNATGKSRTLAALNSFAVMLRGGSIMMGQWKILAEDQGQQIRIELAVESRRVLREELRIGDDVRLTRNELGVGKIYYQSLEKSLDFEVAPHTLAMASKRDKMQHSYLESLNRWAEGERLFCFGDTMGREVLIVEIEGQNAQPSPFETAKLPVLARQAFRSEHRDAVVERVKEDMLAVGYAIDGLEWGPVQDYRGLGESRAILVHERGLPSAIPHMSLSQGMFRALAIFMHLHYILLDGSPTCILIDDIGEGLDYSRATALIRRLIERVRERDGADIQLVMTTNDQFVMNAVDLKYWSVIVREGSECRVLNERNSKKIFDDFRFIGLNNFDFLEMEFWNREPDLDPA